MHWNGTAWKRVKAPHFGAAYDDLRGVTAVSSARAWAVGFSSDGSFDRTLVLAWNGTAWKRQKSPNVGTLSNELYAIDAASGGDVWAVGGYFDFTGEWTLALHWNGASWKRELTPNFDVGSPASNELRGVSAVSGSNVWAVGTYGYSVGHALAIHCC